MNKFLVGIALVLLLTSSTLPVMAQTSDLPPGPLYIVRPGDTLWDIALRFNTTVAEIITYNNLPGEVIYEGAQLVIPGMENVQGVLNIFPVPLGESLLNISRFNAIDRALLIELNHITSPSELYAGYEMIVIENPQLSTPGPRATLPLGSTLLELAVTNNVHPWQMVILNRLGMSATALPGDTLYTSSGPATSSPGVFPEYVTSVTMDPLPIVQGQTVQIRVASTAPFTVAGSLADLSLNFRPFTDGSQIALQGIHVMTEPGLYPLELDFTSPDGATRSFEQMVLVADGYFRQDPILVVEPSTIDPAITEPENALLLSIVGQPSPERFWQSLFSLPVDPAFCIRSMYGNRRSYNGSDYIYFHSGVDYGICSETHPYDIFAPASGKVIFTGLLAVRGNATIIDHGWGVFSGFWHQEQILVNLGDMVLPGQLIGLIGATGRVTGPHLHWEVWVNGIQVDPLEWLVNEYPH